MDTGLADLPLSWQFASRPETARCPPRPRLPIAAGAVPHSPSSPAGTPPRLPGVNHIFVLGYSESARSRAFKRRTGLSRPSERYARPMPNDKTMGGGGIIGRERRHRAAAV